jgi:hypothetical protein
MAIPAHSPSRWVTREHPKIDRIACPWLIRRFIDPEAQILYVPTHRVYELAATGATAFDTFGAKLGHVGDRCSFDAFLAQFGLDDPALARLALIVRGADTNRLDLAPECAGLYAISQGLSMQHGDDHEMLAHGLVLYDAIYAWCRKQAS